MAEPPLDAGNVHDRPTDTLVADAVNDGTASGASAGTVAGAEASENGPTPTELTAATRKTYVAPGCKGVATYEGVADTASEMAVQAVSEASLY
jgi:hypothetical protein